MYFFDESRFGTHSKIGHGWFQKGSRTPIKVKLGFQNFYIYSAVNPKDGDSLSLELPKVNTDCMDVFLAEMSAHLGDGSAILVMDGAGWHKTKELKIPKNIEIVLLPPYSPELNPVERLWGYIKQNTIKNRVYNSLKDLEFAVGNIITGMGKDVIKQVCNINY